MFLPNEFCRPELYIHTVYDRIFGDSPAKITVYTPYIYMVLANRTNEQGWPIPHIYRVGQNRIYTLFMTV